MVDVETLEREFCPPLDSALFSAIVLDHDLADPAGLGSAREILEALKQSALEEDSLPFDPSGNSTNAFADTEDGSCSQADGSSSNTHASRSEVTESTVPSTGRDGKHVGESSGETETETDRRQDGYMEEAETLDFAGKVELLREMFPNSSEFSVSHTLKKCNANYTRALEELLNHAFFHDMSFGDDENRVRTSGVDAFSEDNTARRARKRKDKKRRKAVSEMAESVSDSHASAVQTSAWDKSRKDIAFVSSRVDMSTQAVASVYHKSGASLPATITALISTTPSSHPKTDPKDVAVIKAHALELGKDFPSITPTHLEGLVRITHPSTAAAHELAVALTTPATKVRGGIEVVPRYAAVDLDAEANPSPPWTSITSKKRADHTARPQASAPLHHRAIAAAHDASADRYFTQASAAYRRGRSDHLMGAAAGYYSQLGRDFAARRAEASSDAADALVQGQSSLAHMDLHGVSVKDAVRIARERTEHWWRSSGRRVMGVDGRVRVEGGGDSHLTIVTGVGNHSKGGIGKIGPAVGKMLVQEGWQVVFGEGLFTVTGRKR